MPALVAAGKVAYLHFGHSPSVPDAQHLAGCHRTSERVLLTACGYEVETSHYAGFQSSRAGQHENIQINDGSGALSQDGGAILALKLKTTPQQTSALHGRPEHACAAAAMQSCVATNTNSSHTAYGSAVHIPSPQPREIIVLSDSDTGSSDMEDVMLHRQSGAGEVAAAESAAAQRPAVQSFWQAAVRAAFLRGCSEQVSRSTSSGANKKLQSAPAANTQDRCCFAVETCILGSAASGACKRISS